MYKIYLKFVTAFLLLISGGYAFAGFSVDTYKNNSESEIIQAYIWGVGNGLLNANVYIRGTALGPMFCPNPSKNYILSKLRNDDFIRILENEIVRAGAGGSENIEKLLFQGMLNDLRCSRAVHGR